MERTIAAWAGFSSGALERRDHFAGEGGADDAPRRRVDGHREVKSGVVELLDPRQGLVEDPGGERVDEVGLLGHGQEAIG